MTDRAKAERLAGETCGCDACAEFGVERRGGGRRGNHEEERDPACRGADILEALLDYGKARLNDVAEEVRGQLWGGEAKARDRVLTILKRLGAE